MRVSAAAVAVAMLVVAGCSSPQQMLANGAASAAASATVSKVSPANVGRLSTLCQWVQPLAVQAMASPKQAVQVVGEFGNAYCGQLLAGSVPATTDAGTESWLADLYKGLSQS